MLSGERWEALTGTVTGRRDVGMERFTFVGVRDLSEGQRRKLGGVGSEGVLGRGRRRRLEEGFRGEDG